MANTTIASNRDWSYCLDLIFRLYLRKFSCDRLEILAVSIPSIQLSNKTACNYLSPFSGFSVQNFCGRTDSSPKRLGFLPNQEFICMSMPMSIISQISASLLMLSIPKKRHRFKFINHFNFKLQHAHIAISYKDFCFMKCSVNIMEQWTS